MLPFPDCCGSCGRHHWADMAFVSFSGSQVTVSVQRRSKNFIARVVYVVKAAGIFPRYAGRPRASRVSSMALLHKKIFEKIVVVSIVIGRKKRWRTQVDCWHRLPVLIQNRSVTSVSLHCIAYPRGCVPRARESANATSGAATTHETLRASIETEVRQMTFKKRLTGQAILLKNQSSPSAPAFITTTISSIGWVILRACCRSMVKAFSLVNSRHMHQLS